MAGGRQDLTREDWLIAGQAMLRQAGPRALRLRALAGSLDISTGSFYHHFKDFEDYLGQLADYYSGEQLSGNLAKIQALGGSPLETIRRAADLALSQDLPRLAMAMRAWARGDARALTAVRRLDQVLVSFFAANLEALGHGPEEALARAYLLVASATADMEPPAALPRDMALRDLMLAILCGPEAPTGP